MSSSFFCFLSICIAYFTLSIQGKDPKVGADGKGPLKKVSKTSKEPYKSVGLILMLTTNIPEKGKGAKFWPTTCSGTIISPIHILTAAHCIVNDQRRDAKLLQLSDDFKIRFYPGLSKSVFNNLQQGIAAFSDGGWVDKTQQKYYEVNQIQKCPLYTEWKWSEHFPNEKEPGYKGSYDVDGNTLKQYDYAVLTLKTAIENPLVMKLKYDTNLALGSLLYTAGYPGNKLPKYHMYYNKFWIEDFKQPKAKEPKHAADEYDVNTAPLMYDESYESSEGQSGSMIYSMTTSGKFMSKTTTYEIVGVLVADSIGGGPTEAVRLTTESINAICKMMKDSPGENTHWKKQKGCPGHDEAHVSDINLLRKEYDELLDEIDEEEIEIQKTLKLLNQEKRKEYRYGHH